VLFLHSHPRVRETFGKVAVQRGPLVYCAEEADNGSDLHLLSLLPSEGAEVEAAANLGTGTRRLLVWAERTPASGSQPFSVTVPSAQKTQVVLVPYHLWGNLGEGEMRVWLRSKK